MPRRPSSGPVVSAVRRPQSLIDVLDDLERKTQQDLEWSRIVAAVAVRCVGSSRGMDDLDLAESDAAMRVALSESREAFGLLEAGDPLPLDGLRDIRESVIRVERGGALEAHELLHIADVVRVARNLRRFLSSRRSRAPHLAEACSTDGTLDALEDELRAAIDPDGTVADRASADLGRLRAEVSNLRDRIVGRLEELLLKHADILSDRFYTLREGRYVVPVRSDAHERFPGIVHGTSSSGQTVFVEPRAVLPLGNRLKVAQGELEREIARILGILSELVRERVHSLAAAVTALDHADLKHATARFAKDYAATFPELSGEAEISLVASRHPILVLEGGDVVANDLSIRAGHGLVLSGPNAGGKTVALKTLGLAAWMARAGVPVLAGEGSRVGFFSRVLSDVGDEQSLTKNLSTFSAHVRNVSSILAQSNGRSLVLLDELAGGTDPEEGAALACAVVGELCTRGAAVAVTTHYEALKAFALHDVRLRNASVGFDVEALKPTFRVYLDVPGASSALVVASQFGIPKHVVDEARRVLPEQSRSFDDLVRRLQEEQVALSATRATLEGELRDARAAKAAVDEELAELKRRGRASIDEESRRVTDELRRTRQELADLRKRAKDGTEAEQSKLSKQVDELASKVSVGSALAAAEDETRKPLGQEAAANLKAGDRVWLPNLRSQAEVLEAPTKGKVRVAMGPMKLLVDVADLRTSAVAPAPEAAPTKTKSAPAGELPRAFAGPLPMVHDSNSVDVRGMRVDDAVALVESFLDRLYGSSIDVGYVLHGHGTGALKDAIRQKLATSAHYVAFHRAATPEEGGDKYTVIFLR